MRTFNITTSAANAGSHAQQPPPPQQKQQSQPQQEPQQSDLIPFDGQPSNRSAIEDATKVSSSNNNSDDSVLRPTPLKRANTADGSASTIEVSKRARPTPATLDVRARSRLLATTPAQHWSRRDNKSSKSGTNKRTFTLTSAYSTSSSLSASTSTISSPAVSSTASSIASFGASSSSSSSSASSPKIRTIGPSKSFSFSHGPRTLPRTQSRLGVTSVTTARTAASTTTVIRTSSSSLLTSKKLLTTATTTATLLSPSLTSSMACKQQQQQQKVRQPAGEMNTAVRPPPKLNRAQTLSSFETFDANTVDATVRLISNITTATTSRAMGATCSATKDDNNANNALASFLASYQPTKASRASMEALDPVIGAHMISRSSKRGNSSSSSDPKINNGREFKETSLLPSDSVNLQFLPTPPTSQPEPELYIEEEEEEEQEAEEKGKTEMEGEHDGPVAINITNVQGTVSEECQTLPREPFKVTPDDITPRISSDTLVKLLSPPHSPSSKDGADHVDDNTNDFKEKYDELLIIDCRFPYEYKGGHIRSAINITTTNALDRLLLHQPKTANPNHRILIVLHCEFSCERGPRMARHLRTQDRLANMEYYPALFYHEVYVLQGGYRGFFEKFGGQGFCKPEGYIEMNSRAHGEEMELAMRTFKREFSRTASKGFLGTESSGSLTTKKGRKKTLTHQSSSSTESVLGMFARKNIIKSSQQQQQRPRSVLQAKDMNYQTNFGRVSDGDRSRGNGMANWASLPPKSLPAPVNSLFGKSSSSPWSSSLSPSASLSSISSSAMLLSNGSSLQSLQQQQGAFSRFKHTKSSPSKSLILAKIPGVTTTTTRIGSENKSDQEQQK